MSKYIKLYDAIMAMDEWFCEPITPTKILSDLPTIEVSEDCISRLRDYQIEWLTSHCDIELEPKLEQLIIRFLNDTTEMFSQEYAPSVVPTTEQSCDTCKYRELYECSDCRFASKWERIEE